MIGDQIRSMKRAKAANERARTDADRVGELRAMEGDYHASIRVAREIEHPDLRALWTKRVREQEERRYRAGEREQ